AEVCARYGVRPERPYPAPFVRALVGRSLAEGTWPVYGGRRPPNAARGDCGWTLWAEQPDLADAEAAAGFEVLPVTELRQRHQEAWRHLALPPGWAFVLGPDGHADVYQDPSLLEQ